MPILDQHTGSGLISAQEWASFHGSELQVAKWLSNKGHDVELLRPSNIPGHHTPDYRIDGELWEVKSPKGSLNINSKNPYRFVESNLRKAKGQFQNRYGRDDAKHDPIRVIFNSYYHDGNDDLIEQEIIRQKEVHEIDEVLFVNKTGKIIPL